MNFKNPKDHALHLEDNIHDSKDIYILGRGK